MDSDSRLNANTLAIGDISIDTHESSSQAAIPGLLNDIVATHILSTEYFDDPAELARLRVVSRAMRAAVTATGLAFEEMDLVAAMKYGCFSAMKRLQRRGLLTHQEFLCPTAARAGLLQELKLLRENNSPWDEGTCCAAAAGGHIHVLEWAHANGCPCRMNTYQSAAAFRVVEVVARELMPVGRAYVRVCGAVRKARGAAVGARERLPVGREDACIRDDGGATRFGGLGESERRPPDPRNTLPSVVETRTRTRGETRPSTSTRTRTRDEDEDEAGRNEKTDDCKNVNLVLTPD